MHRKIKLIWDFRGPNAQKVAEHHAIHLNEFSTTENLKVSEISCHKVSDFYTIAYMIVNENDMFTVRDSLKPHRGEIAK